MTNELAKIQAEIKAPKGQYNKFGNYRYRSCEDIVEAAKPVLAKYGYSLILSDEIVNIGDRFYVKSRASIARLVDKEETIVFEAFAFAREEEVKKGMDGAQITGSASSYARKYALNGLFAIDDTKDPDSNNNHQSDVSEDQRKELEQLLYSSSYDEEMKKKMFVRINNINTIEDYEKAQASLLSSQMDDKNRIANGQNYSATDIKKTQKAVK